MAARLQSVGKKQMPAWFAPSGQGLQRSDPEPHCSSLVPQAIEQSSTVLHSRLTKQKR